MGDSDSDEENVIRYGTPLEPFEEDEVPSKRKFQQPADQYAVDAHGRRRFHGAFTGGFSAGHGNSVGTPEGWTPATFKSSRAEKAQISNQRPEDYMDEEDRSEFGIAPKYMQTQSEFSGQKRPRQKQFHDGPIPGEPVLDQVVRAVHETGAVRMLRAMGWRPGQGAGQRLSGREKRAANHQHKVYGCYMPPECRQKPQQSDSDSSDSEYDYDNLFAPDDYEPYILTRKNDRFGLGYSGLSRHSVLGNLVGEYGSDAGSSKSHLMMKDKGKKVSIRGQAFGVGAFEVEDDDIYATEDMSHYDYALGGAVNDQRKKPAKQEANVLEGFVKASKPLPPVPAYPPPALPRDYTPAPAGARRSRFEPTDHAPRDQGLGRHELTAEARGALLGETPIPKPPEPVPDTQPNKHEDVIAKIAGRNVNFVSTNLSQSEPKELDFISIKDTGNEVSTYPQIFRPFVGNPQKQSRYERYLKDKDGFALEGDSKMDKLSEWERNREMVEFEQAAKLYRPLTGEMGDRFTHASQPDEAVNPLCAVAKSSISYGLATQAQIEAAEKGVYGVMTRREVSWRPESLVYKRFNIPDPGGVRQETTKEDKPKVSYSIFSYLESSVHNKESFAKEQSKFSGSKSITDVPKPKTVEENKIVTKPEIIKPTTLTEKVTGFSKRLTVAELFMKESEKDLKSKDQGVVTDTIEKFDKMDLYKSIFLSDSEEEDVPQPDANKTIVFEDLIDVPRNVERNTSPPRGIFANIDFDELNSWKRNTDSNKNDSKAPKTTEHKNSSKETAGNKEGDGHTEKTNAEKGQGVAEEDIYGPKIPENLLKRLEAPEVERDSFRPIFRKIDKEEIHAVNSSSSSDSWVDIKEMKSKKLKKKKSKKHKSKHKKSKHKKKDK